MNNVFRNILVFIIVLLPAIKGTTQHLKAEKNVQKEQATILIPFMPGSCHQCNNGFYKNLEILNAQKVNYSFVIPDNYSDDLEELKKKYKLDGYQNQKFIFSSALFDKYHLYEQSFVLQFGADANYKMYNNAKGLISDLEALNKTERVDLGDYKIKKSTFDLWVNNKDQFCFKNILQTNAFDYLNLKSKKQAFKISITDEQLLNIYRLHFKDTLLAISKLNEVRAVTDIPDKDRFEDFQFVNDSLFTSSHHTYIANMVDSILGGFSAINIYKDGSYLESRAVSKEQLPTGYNIIPKFHIYNNNMFMLVVKDRLESDKPNHFLAKFSLENGTYHFEKMLPFTVPAINKNVGYRYIDLSFSGRYFMTSISNILYDLETEQSLALNIPVNKEYEFAHLINSSKSVPITIKDIFVQYPSALISYYSTDENGVTTNIILNYNLQDKNVIGRIQMPADQSRFLKPDLSHFGYFLWMPEEDKNDYFVYKKLF